MIESFASKETEKIFRGQVSRKLPRDIQRTARRKLLYLHEAKDVQDLRRALPGIVLKNSLTIEQVNIVFGLIRSGAFSLSRMMIKFAMFKL
jgi:hypothetical protein